jgi:hypothetical protein
MPSMLLHRNKYYNPETLEDYIQCLARHDWFYYFSDQWLSSEPSDELLALATDAEDDNWRRAYNEAHAKVFNTESFYPEGDTTRVYVCPFADVLEPTPTY